VASKLRCINVPARLPAASAAAQLAASAAAAEPLKAEMNDSLHCRVVLFMTYSGIDQDLAGLFQRYFANDHSRNRAAMDGSEMSSGDLLRAITDAFNDSDDFDQYCANDMTMDHCVLPSIFEGLHPDHLPTPGKVTSDQLMTMIRWSRKTATRLIQM
jgi:hypothetical protein